MTTNGNGVFGGGDGPGSLWRECLSLCLEAIAAGSLGIAAVITDAAGAVISGGRNQLFDSLDSANPIRNTLVSHAEMNAIAGLPAALRRDKSIVLYTTVEPCPMCLGAIAMSPIRRVVMASRDPWAGAAGLAEAHPWMRGKRIRFEFESGEVERVFSSLHVYSLLQRRDLPLEHEFYAAIGALYPDAFGAMVSHRDDPALAGAIAAGDVRQVLAYCGVA